MGERKENNTIPSTIPKLVSNHWLLIAIGDQYVSARVTHFSVVPTHSFHFFSSLVFLICLQEICFVISLREINKLLIPHFVFRLSFHPIIFISNGRRLSSSHFSMKFLLLLFTLALVGWVFTVDSSHVQSYPCRKDVSSRGKLSFWHS